MYDKKLIKKKTKTNKQQTNIVRGVWEMSKLNRQNVHCRWWWGQFVSGISTIALTFKDTAPHSKLLWEVYEIWHSCSFYSEE